MRPSVDDEQGEGKQNGAAITRTVTRAGTGASSSPPAAIAELAEGCVRFVERALGVKLDYQPETLPILDHYIGQATALVRERPEMLSVVAQAAGAYLGEVVRRRYPSWWRDEGDPLDWQVQLESVFLAVTPVRLIVAALRREEASTDPPYTGAPRDGDRRRAADAGAFHDADADADECDQAPLLLEEEDRAAVAARLAELPAVTEEEFYAPSTRVEVIDIAVEAIRARRMAAGEQAEAMLTPADYDRAE